VQVAPRTGSESESGARISLPIISAVRQDQRSDAPSLTLEHFATYMGEVAIIKVDRKLRREQVSFFR
jgi:hypothetical protein